MTKDNKKKVEKKNEVLFTGQYFYSVGRRKTSVAQVRIYLNDQAKINKNRFIVNGKDVNTYFPLSSQRTSFFEPLHLTGLSDSCAVSVLVSGGGLSGQAGAIRLGVSRALVKFDNELRSILKADGFLTRDARKVERKKPGLKKARRAPQWAKR